MTATGAPEVREPSVSAVRVAADPESGRWKIGVIGKRTWTVTRGRCVLSPQQVPLVEEPLYDEDRAVLIHDADVLLNRTRTDIIVEGHVYPPDGRTPFDFGVQVGGTLRLARSFGPRRVTLDAYGGLRFSAPELIEKIPLGWESAYGGVDFEARADIGDPFEEALAEAGTPPDPRYGLFAYPRNPVGRGYLIEPTAQAVERCALPLIEDREALVTPATLARQDFLVWPAGPPVAAFGWLSYTYFPRSTLLGAVPNFYDDQRVPPSSFLEVRQRELSELAVTADRPVRDRLGIGVAQSAALGLRAASVKPGDAVAVHGLHPREAKWNFPIPAETPRMGLRFKDEKALELPPPVIRTVFIEPDEDRLTLVWTAEMALPSPPGPKRMGGLQHIVLWT